MRGLLIGNFGALLQVIFGLSAILALIYLVYLLFAHVILKRRGSFLRYFGLALCCVTLFLLANIIFYYRSVGAVGSDYAIEESKELIRQTEMYFGKSMEEIEQDLKAQGLR